LTLGTAHTKVYQQRRYSCEHLLDVTTIGIIHMRRQIRRTRRRCRTGRRPSRRRTAR